MVETPVNKKALEETFRSFLTRLDVFLDSKAVVEDAPITILYVQEPEEAISEFYARGLLKIANFAYPFEVTYDYELGVVKVDSEIFHFHMTNDELKKFLEEHGGEA